MNGQHNPLAAESSSEQGGMAPQQPQGMVPQGQVSGMIVFGPSGPQIVETSATNQGLTFAQSQLPPTQPLIRSIQRNAQAGDVVRIKERFIVEES